MRQTGIFYGIGVGPGDPELMTLLAVRLIRQCGIIAVPLDNSREQQAGQKTQMKEDFLVAVACVDPIKDGYQFLFRLVEQRLQLIHPGTLFQKVRSGFLVGVIIPLKTAGKAKMVFFIHTVEQSVVGAGGNLTGYAGGIDRKVQLLTLEHADTSGFFVPKKSTAP